MRKDNCNDARTAENRKGRRQDVSGAVKDLISPASAADIRFDRLPASSALRPSFAIIGRWFGARPPVTAIWIAIELKLANPHSAKVAIATEIGAKPACSLPRSMKATNSLSTTLVPNSPPTAALSSHGTPISHITGRKTAPITAWNDRSG